MRKIFLTCLFASSAFAQPNIQYGGEKGQSAFEKTTEEAISLVKEKLQKGTPFQSLVMQLKNLRYEVARNHYSKEKAQDFKRFRDDPQGYTVNTTPLNQGAYHAVRADLRQKIQEIPQNVWVQEKTDRYRLRVLPLKDWPVSVHFNANIEADLLSNDFAQKNDLVTEITLPLYIKQFLKSGCVEITQEAQTPEGADITKLDMRLHDMLNEMVWRQYPGTLPPKKETTWRTPLQKHFLDVINTVHKEDLTFDAKLYRLFILEHEVKVGEHFIPGAFYVGSLDYTQPNPYTNSLIMLGHPPRYYVRAFFEETTRHFNEALKTDPKDKHALKKAVAKFQYYWSLTMPITRGSAAVSEWLTAGLYKHFGYKAVRNREKMRDTVDNTVFSTLTLKEFQKRYAKGIKLEPLGD